MAKKCKKGYKKVDGRCVQSSGNNFNKRKKVNMDALWIIISVFGVVALLLLFFYGGERGWFKSLAVIENTDIVNYLNTPQETISNSCSLALSPNTIYVGDRTTGSIIDGKNSLCQVFANDGTSWAKVYEGYTDANGVLVNTRNINVVGNFMFRAICDQNNNNRVDTGDCLTNQVELNVLPRPDTPPIDEGYDVGDVVGGGSGSGSLTGSEEAEIVFDLGDVSVGGNCYLGAKIYTNWEYANDKCYGVQGQQGVDWVFVDSSSIAWSYADAFPQSHDIDLCPLNWDGVNQWKLIIDPYSENLPECQINYNYNVEIYICECN